MATAVLNRHGFAEGTSVSAWPAQNSVNGGPPAGPSVATAAVTSGVLTFTGLTVGVRYIAYAAGRGVQFRADELLGENPAPLPASDRQRLRYAEEMAGAGAVGLAVERIREGLPLFLHYLAENGDNADTALAAAVAAQPSEKVAIDFSGCGTLVFAVAAPSLAGRRGVVFTADGSPGQGAGMGTELIYTAAGTTPFLDCQRVNGFLSDRVNIRYNNALFTGKLMDFRNMSGSGSLDTRDVRFRDCYIGSNPGDGLTSAAALLWLPNSHGISLENVALRGAQRAAIGRDVVGDYCIGFSMKGGSTEKFVLAPFHNGGESWSFTHDLRAEALAGGAAGLYSHDVGFLYKSLAFRDIWTGDVTAAGGYWVKAAGTSLILDGGRWGHEFAGGGAILVDANDCRGIYVRGGEYIGGAQVIDFGVTTGHLDVDIRPAKLGTDPGSGTTPLRTAGTLPEGILLSYDGKWHVVGAGGEPAFQNSWSNFGAPYATAAYRIDHTGTVHLRGLVAGGLFAGESVFTLAAGFRPAANDIYPIRVAGSLVGQVEVTAAGAVGITAPNNTWASLAGVSFKVA